MYLLPIHHLQKLGRDAVAQVNDPAVYGTGTTNA